MITSQDQNLRANIPSELKICSWIYGDLDTTGKGKIYYLETKSSIATSRRSPTVKKYKKILIPHKAYFNGESLSINSDLLLDGLHSNQQFFKYFMINHQIFCNFRGTSPIVHNHPKKKKTSKTKKNIYWGMNLTYLTNISTQ